MKAMITGVAGFIGSTLAERVLANGDSVVGVDSLTDYYAPANKLANLAELREDSFQFIRGDLTSLPLSDLLGDVDVVFHLAGQPGVRRSWGSTFGTYTHANVNATQALLEACRARTNVRRFVYSSSSSVYGDAERYPTFESDLPRPKSPYGVTKLAAEHLCNLYAQNFGVPTISLRYFTVYGPRQRPDMAFTRFIKAGLAGETIKVFGDGEQVRDFTYVADAVEANLRAAVAVSEPGSIYNIGGGSSASVNHVLGELERILQRPLSVHRGEDALGDVRRTAGDTTRALEGLGWQPKVGLAHGLEEQVAWVQGSLQKSSS
jgi:UDP-glucuronate 4-epimerase